MTIRPPDAYLMYTTNRTSQLSPIAYRGAIALGAKPTLRESLKSTLQGREVRTDDVAC
jgi:hypothetical protein